MTHNRTMAGRNPTRTRQAILDAARRRFAEDGFDGATIRSIAADAGVDAALVSRYFGGKDGLLAEAAQLHVELPDLTLVAPEHLAAAIMPTFIRVWEDDPTFVALLRTSAVNPVAAAALRGVFAGQVGPALERIAVDSGRERAALWGSIVIGVAFDRYVLKTEPLASMATEELATWLAPVMQQVLTGRR
jgi:AcrR family transcriptional regulator